MTMNHLDFMAAEGHEVHAKGCGSGAGGSTPPRAWGPVQQYRGSHFHAEGVGIHEGGQQGGYAAPWGRKEWSADTRQTWVWM